MPNTIAIEEVNADSGVQLGALITQIHSRLLKRPILRSAKASSTNPAESFLILIWGPPGAKEEEVKTVLESLPNQTCALCTSSEDWFNSEGVSLSKWFAVIICSRFITPHISWSPLPQDKETSGVDWIKPFRDAFPEKIRDNYFGRNTRKLDDDLEGAFGVKYRRPAYLLTFMPGTGWKNPTTWPISNKDYQLIEVLSSITTSGVPIFGGSAGSSSEKGRLPWVAALNKNGESFFQNCGIVACLVQTDLSFGMASAHGFGPNKDEGPFRVVEVEKSSKCEMLNAATVSRADRYHKINSIVADDGAVPKVKLLSASSKGEPLSPKSLPDPWHTLGYYGNDEFIPNPPYAENRKRTNKLYQFLLPIENGAPLYTAKVTKKSVLDAVDLSINNAMTSGSVNDVAGVFFSDCRGRLNLLNRIDGAKFEQQRAQTRLGKAVPIFGMYGDGETCPTPRGINVHRNWTIAALVLGADFNANFDMCARALKLSNIDKKLAQPLKTRDAILTEIIDAMIDLLQPSGCHIRLLDGNFLVIQHVAGAAGPLSEAFIDNKLSVEKDVEFAAVQAFKARQLITFNKQQILRIDRKKWKEHSQDALNNIEVCLAQPMIDRTEPLGVLSLHSNDADFIKGARGKRVTDILSVLAIRAAIAIRAHATYQFLNNVICATEDQDLIGAIMSCAINVLGRRVELSVLRPDPVEKKRLTCIAYSSENAKKVWVSIDPKATKKERGVIGHAYLTKIDQFWENAPIDCSGEGDKPLHKECIPGLPTNFAICLKQEGNQKLLGILNAEAPLGALTELEHKDDLINFAKAFSAYLSRQNDPSHHLKSKICDVPNNQLVKSNDKNSLYYQFIKKKSCTSFVISVDIRKSTELMRKANKSSQFAKFIDKLATRLAKIIKSNYGVYDKFTGDGILAYFPIFFSGEHAGLHIVKAAFECHECFEKLYRKNEFIFCNVPADTGLGIGIDFGTVSQSIQLQNTVVGNAVVYACRMGGCDAGKTLLSPRAYEAVRMLGGNLVFKRVKFNVKNESSMCFAYEVKRDKKKRRILSKEPYWVI